MMTLFLTIVRLMIRSKKTHLLVLFQNNYELRGSGGFLTQLLDVTVGGMRFSPTFRHDYLELKPKVFIQAPPEVQKYLGHRNWPLRDTNIFGDFRVSAEHVISNYRSIFHEHEVSGVAAVNFHFVESLLHLLGPVRAGGKTFDEKNIFSEVSSSVSDIDRHNLEALNARKHILKRLYDAVFLACLRRFWKWPRLAKLVKESAAQKDLQFFFAAPETQSKFARKSYTNDHSRKDMKDFLGIVENNYLGIKSNRYIRRTIFHDVAFELDRRNKKLSDAQVRVKIEWQHFGHYNYPLSGTYQSLSKISVPAEAQDLRVLQAPEEPAVIRTPDAAVVEVHQILGIQRSSVIEFTYRLPAGFFDDGRYSFLFIKQSGVLQEHVHETVRFPDQYRAEIASRKNADGFTARTVDNILFLDRMKADRDYSYECRAVLHQLAPRIFYHEMTAPNIFEIRFNEPVFPLDNFSVKISGNEGGELFEIAKTEFFQDNRHLTIHTRNVPAEEEKYYRISIAGLANGVGTELGERTVTTVYRTKYFDRAGRKT